jgi:5-formyltetrahydrofolate cyclo-ligase
MRHNKKELRSKYKSLRSQLSKNDIDTKSLAIANQLLMLPIWTKTYFHIFLPIAEKKEVDTELILHLLSGKDKEIVVSKTDFNSIKMAHFLLTDNTKIQKNEYNIPEPIDGIEVSINRLQVVFVPLLAYDNQGHRVGYGKGFYDKFLGECSSETIKIGLSFFDPEEAITDVHKDDIQLNYCITPDTIHTFEK